ncbi:hypothetical protein MIR68_007944 [Amoeboaphelidium protococcarum]|nr:hypothetical protein MIR68_007944 [Amoeboaphelidium protococcarum]
MLIFSGIVGIQTVAKSKNNDPNSQYEYGFPLICSAFIFAFTKPDTELTLSIWPKDNASGRDFCVYTPEVGGLYYIAGELIHKNGHLMINTTQCYPVDPQFDSFAPAANVTLTGAINKCDNGKVVVGVSVYQYDKEVEVTCKYLARRYEGLTSSKGFKPKRVLNVSGQLESWNGHQICLDGCSLFVEPPKKIEDVVNTVSSSVQSSSKSVGLSWLTTPNNKQKSNQSDEDQSDDEEPKNETAKKRGKRARK